MFSYTVIYEKGNVFAAVCVPVHCLGGGGGGEDFVWGHFVGRQHTLQHW